MIFDYEAERIERLIKAKNKGTMLIGSFFTYDNMGNIIKTFNEKQNYLGEKDSISIKERMIFKAKNNNAFEVHLQAYIMQNYDKEPLNALLFSNSLDKNKYWIGNEVSCGVGMQRIDIMTIIENENQVCIKIIELKHTEPYDEIITTQLKWYVKWCNDYVIPNLKGKQIVLEPVILAKKKNNTNAFKITCQNNQYSIEGARLKPIQYIGFNMENNNITFERIF